MTANMVALLTPRGKHSYRFFHLRIRSQAREPQEKVNVTALEFMNDLLDRLKYTTVKEKDKVKVQSNWP